MLLLYLGILVVLTTIFCELASRQGWLPYWVSRKVLHIAAVGCCAVAGFYADEMDHRQLLTWIVAGAEILLLGLIGLGGLMREESGRRPWGIVWFPLAFLLLLLFTQSSEMIGFYMAILAVCDPAATITGKLLSAPSTRDHNTLDAELTASDRPQKSWLTTPYQLTGDPKTPVGNLAFLASFLLLCFLLPIDYSWGADAAYGIPITPWERYPIPNLVAFGLMLTAGEALGSRGLDNLIIPLLTAVLFTLYVPSIGSPEMFLTIITVALFCYLTVRRRSLSTGGAVTASLLGILIILSAGVSWLLPLFLFFGSSSLIGRLFPSSPAAGDLKHKQPRDATQVLANGAVYCLIALVLHQSPEAIYLVWSRWEFLLLVVAAVATADTWSSEIGQYFRQPTWDIVRWRRVPAGLSGGISLAGTLAGLGGAAFIAATGFWLLPTPALPPVMLITALGFGGMLVDSILGALLQVTFKDPSTEALSDVCPPEGTHASGLRWMTNDLVNFLAILLMAAIAMLIPYPG